MGKEFYIKNLAWSSFELFIFYCLLGLVAPHLRKLLVYKIKNSIIFIIFRKSFSLIKNLLQAQYVIIQLISCIILSMSMAYDCL